MTTIIYFRYKDISEVSQKICDLLKENLQLFCNAAKKPEADRHLLNISGEPGEQIAYLNISWHYPSISRIWYKIPFLLDFNTKSMPTYKSKMLRMAKKSLQARKIELKINKTQTPTLPDNEATYNLVGSLQKKKSHHPLATYRKCSFSENISGGIRRHIQ